ncbi:hypothetical protein BOO69_08270 [Sulfitobacter alexandrii]|uniref:DUF3168 domain-containing protein n=1 Tax=Sulfitobacter alexandrii TaxID=1917485 RepID=A0A1J0WGH8_9RHOB|nr:DUF3168 domain-containing protein [Sulfitobacter alexandrii]APE43411.1 hypothetical protein BOO69_08270 [Sulfitobacter alexandrii]
MAAPANELQAAIYQILRADSAVSALVGDGVFDRVPKAGDVPPYITFGPSDEIEADMLCITSAEHSLQIDVWSERQGGFKECKEITYAVKKALHEVEIDLPTHALVQIRVVRRLHLREPDGITSHGVVTVEADIEEAG